MSLVLVVLIGSGIVLFLLNQSQSEDAGGASVVKSLIQTEQLVAVPLGVGRVSLLSALNDAKQNASENLTHLYTTKVGLNGTQLVAGPNDVLTVLAPRLPGSLSRSITNLNFGVRHNGGKTTPFIILKTNSFDTARAGMFNWERFMSADLAPFFGDVVNKSLDPQSRTSNQIVTAEFVDTYISNRYIRSLYDETGTERIVYSIINQHTIVITTNRENLTELVRRLQL